MTNNKFDCLFLENEDGKNITSSIKTLDDQMLPEGDVTIAIKYSTLNYKDGMIIKGQGNMVREYPHIPGIDFSGVVEDSTCENYRPGDNVILTGWGVGETHWGGFSERARVKSEWLVPLPSGLSLKQAMSIGTAGFSAMLAIMIMEDLGLKTDVNYPILVTGAAGGVGSIAIAILANLGYQVAAGTGRKEAHQYLRNLGASSLIEREALLDTPKGPLSRQMWSGVIDNVGGALLGNTLPSVAHSGTVASVGNAGGIEFSSNVLPFLLRGLNLCGINSSHCPIDRRITAWNRLSTDLPLKTLDGLTNEVPLDQIAELANKILKGKIQGRTVIKVSDE